MSRCDRVSARVSLTVMAVVLAAVLAVAGCGRIPDDGAPVPVPGKTVDTTSEVVK